MEQEDIDILNLRANHSEACLQMVRGTELEKKGNGQLAKEAYLKSQEKLEVALAIRCDRPHCVGPKWRAARAMQKKMRRKLSEIEVRLSELNEQQRRGTPSAYDKSLTFHRSTSNSVTVEELFSIKSGVKMFYVTAKGEISTISESSSLSIYKFSNQDATAWLEISGWKFPLVPNQSPVLRSEYGTYFFPDANSPQSGDAIGVVLPSNIEANIIRMFEYFLTKLAVLKIGHGVILKEIGEEERKSHEVSGALVTGGEFIADVITKTAEVTGKLIHLGASKLTEWLTPEDPVTVDPKFQEQLEILRATSEVVQQVSGFVVNKLEDATVALGKSLAPHVQKAGTHLLGASKSVESAREMDNMMIVAAGGLQGLSTIYMSLVSAAKNLASCVGSETVHVVRHKYGTEAGAAVDNAVNSLGNFALTAHNVRNFGVKAIAKRTAKDTGRAVLQQYGKK